MAAIVATLISPWISEGTFVTPALLWLIPDRRIEKSCDGMTFRMHSVRLKSGGKLEVAQQMAAHESARRTGLYDRRGDEISLDEVERITIAAPLAFVNG